MLPALHAGGGPAGRSALVVIRLRVQFIELAVQPVLVGWRRHFAGAVGGAGEQFKGLGLDCVVRLGEDQEFFD